MVALTEGALERIMNGEDVQKGIFQIVAIKRLDPLPQGGPTRVRISLSDGRHSTTSALLSSQKSEAAARGELTTYAIIELTEYFTNTVQNRRLLILTDFTVITPGESVGEELGSPVPLDLAAINDTSAGGGGAISGRPVLAAQQPPILKDKPNAATNGANGARAVAVSHQQGAPNGAGGPPPNVFPINSVSPYQNKWCIRARVTKKYPIKTYNNSRGEGKLFSVDLADESGELRATGFNQECDKFYEFLKDGAVYYIKGGSIRTANRQWTSINNDYELTFSSETQIEPCFEDNVYQLPTLTFNFVKFDKLTTHPRDRVIDVIGVVESYAQCQSLTSRKNNQELKKRDIRLVDETMNSVSLTLWGTEAEQFEPDGHPIVAVKGIRISEYNGLSLSTVQGAQIHMNPDVGEAHRLRGWYDTKGHDAPVKSLTMAGGSGGGGGNTYTPIGLAEASHLGLGDKPDYYSVKAFINSVKKENCLYKACPTEDCNKKLIEQGPGRHRCEKCNKEVDAYKWRLMLQITICDFSGSQPITLFNEQAEQMLGISAQDLADLKDRDEQEFNTTLEKLLFKQYSYRLRAKAELYNDESRVKVMCHRADELNLIEYNKFLIEEIQKLEAMSDPM